ncbi:MAG: radical SAM protein, partial [Gammaproteobacteria bacterium]|nr:radical SAM protein [Gammaproteobacteria bacterium]
MSNVEAILDRAANGAAPSAEEAMTLADSAVLARLLPVAASLRDRGFANVITYSKKVFIPLTHLCRNVCHYCTFAQAPKKIEAPYLTIDEILETARGAASVGCKEALFTLGEKPELRYQAARDALSAMGYETTTDYLHAAAAAVFEETRLLPHLNPGTLTLPELERLRRVSASMGLMLESSAERLTH